jgi:hypothetical protein
MDNPYSKPVKLVDAVLNRAQAAEIAWKMAKKGDWSDTTAIEKARELIVAAKLLEAELDANWKTP